MDGWSLGCLLFSLLGLSLSWWRCLFIDSQGMRHQWKDLSKTLFYCWGLVKKRSSFVAPKPINEKRWIYLILLVFPGAHSLRAEFFNLRDKNIWIQKLYFGRSCYILWNVQKHPSHCLLDAHSILHPLLQQPKSVQILPSFFQVKPRWDAPLHSSLFDCLSLISLYEKCM